MTEVKYIVLVDEAGKEYPVLFPRALAHKDVSDGICGEARLSMWSKVIGWLNPVSAGFYYPDTKSVGGNSESLKLASRPADAALINKMISRDQP